MGSDYVVDKVFENVEYFEHNFVNLSFSPLSSLAAFLVRYSAMSEDKELAFISVVLNSFSQRLTGGTDDLSELDIASVKEEWRKFVPDVIRALLEMKDGYDSKNQDLLIESSKKLLSFASKLGVYSVFRAGRVTPSEQEVQAMKEDIERLKMGLVALAQEMRQLSPQVSSQDEEPGG